MLDAESGQPDLAPGPVPGTRDAAVDGADDGDDEADSQLEDDPSGLGSGEDAVAADTPSADEAQGDPDSGPTTFGDCFAALAPEGDEIGPQYDQFSPVIGSHCHGTNHQDIRRVDRVVFLGDSVTVGTPPTPDAEFYRSILAGKLAEAYGLDAPDGLWRAVNWVTGTTLLTESGDFASCAEWGAKTDDLLHGGEQLANCFDGDDLAARTLVIMTVGGNDLASLTKGFADGESIEALWDRTEAFVDEMRQAVEWLTTFGRFPNGIYVIFTNLYEFTDATGDVTACPAASLAGFGAAVEDPALAEMVVWAMESFMSIAVDTGTDMLFLLESFCGHGYARNDPEGRCYRGPDAELWFDLSCTHPNPVGHAVIADMFMSVVLE